MTDPSSFSAQTFFDVHACGEQLKPMGVGVDLAHLVHWARLICHDAGLGADALTQPGANRLAVMATRSPESAGMVLAALDLFSTLRSIPECGQALADPQARPNQNTQDDLVSHVAEVRKLQQEMKVIMEQNLLNTGALLRQNTRWDSEGAPVNGSL